MNSPDFKKFKNFFALGGVAFSFLFVACGQYNNPFVSSNLPTSLSPTLAPTATTPVVIPTMAATAIPGQYPTIAMTVLGPVPCSGSVSGASPAILRSTTEWNNYLASSPCANPAGAISLSGFDFSTQSVLILQFQDCPSNSITTSINTWNVYQMSGYKYARCDIGAAGTASPQTGCTSIAVAIPATNEGATWTICEQLPSYHCLTAVTP